MQEFRVKALYLGGKGKKIYRSGDVVTQANVGAPVEELVKKGFLIPIASTDAPPLVPTLDPPVDTDEDFKDLKDLTPAVEPDQVQAPATPVEETEEVVTDTEEGNDLLNELKKEEVESAPESDESVGKLASLEEVNYKFLITELETLGVSHSKNISKKEAYGLWIEAKKQG